MTAQPVLGSRFSVLPNHNTRFSSSNAHGARNATGYSIAQRLHVGAFDKCDQVVLPSNRVNLLDD